MVDVKVYSGGSVSTQRVDDSAFGARVLQRTLKDAIVMYEANRRSGTAKTKTRGEVNGPNHKLWKQKHTGRARMGTTKAPHWRGGGVVFGPQPRDYSYHMPKKARRAALRSALCGKLRDGELSVADGWPADRPSTRGALSVLAALGLRDTSVLVVTEQPDRNVYLSLRNVPTADVAAVADLNARQVLLRKHVVFTPQAFAKLQEQFAAREPSRAERAMASERGGS
jgi:large subunit ribosomal protein L4